jgi:uncharacterized protein (TIGR02391 family)
MTTKRSKSKVRGKRKTPSTPKATKRKHLSARTIQDLRILADQIGKIIPATSPSKGGFCFQTIAKNMGLGKHWSATSDSRKEAIAHFLSKVYQYHPRVFFKIFRENFARGIERRHKAGDPVLQEEMANLDQTLRRLNINLSREIRQLALPTERPKFVPPPYAFQKIVDELSLHPFLRPDCVKLFKDGHINESARKALEKFETYVQAKSGLANIGTDLMGNAFNENNPKVAIADVATKRGRGLQEGFKFISMGSMGFWRNFFSHGDENQIAHQDAVAILAMISHLLNYIDGYVKSDS